ncbi:unnamed protein product [Adineta steineri]|uniref:Ferric-chelate reductase 1 n=1 Tax=Adineta steineri TaxID=433720 RepID=A0A819TQS7_9BILA|nr:unnamed protein product [Adineta steineri]
MFKFIVLLSICIKYGYSYPEGAPQSVCNTMMPNHDIPIQQCQPKYIIQSDKSEYNTNDIVRITVRGSTDRDYFKGILLIAKNENNQQIIGTWSITNSSIKTIACDEKENTGITHVSNDDKLQIEALWHSPSVLPEGNTIIKATIVKTYGEIFVDCFNITLKPKQNNNAPQVQSTIINTERDTFRKTNTNVMWNYANNIVTVTMNTEQVNIGEWHAIGFSLDQQMGDEYVFICQVSATGVTSLRRMHTKAGKRPPSTTVEKVNVTSAIYENGRTTCQFSFETTSQQATDEPAPIVTGKDYYLIYAGGLLRTEEQVAKHNLTFVSSKTYQLQNSETINIDESVTTTPMPITTTAPSTSDIRGNISWTYTNGVTDVKMIITNLKISQWLAIGLSTDDSMGQDHVFICQHFSDNTISLQRFLNPDGHTRPVLADVLPNVGGTFNVSRQKLENGIAYCEFTLSNFVNAKRQTRQLLIPNLSQTAPYQPLIAMGNLDSSNMLIRHARNARTALSKNVVLNQPEIINLDELVTPTPMPITTTASPASDIKATVSWTYTNSITDVKMVITNLKISQWFAIALSLDDSMGQDHVFICQHFADNTISLQRFINPNGHARPELANDLPNVGGTFNVSQQKLENGIAYCDFTLSNFGNTKRHSRQISFPELSQTVSYQPLIAYGDLNSSNIIMRHARNARRPLSKNVLLNQSETINVDESVITTPMPITTVSPATDIRVNVSWTYTNGVTDVKMIINNLKTSQWLAIGLSTDDSMGQDHVFICQHLADNTISLQRFVNPDGHARPELANDPANVGGTFNVSQEKFENGVAHCDFTLSNFGNTRRHSRQISFPELSQTVPYQPLIAFGFLDSSNRLQRHSQNARTALSEKVLLNRAETIVYNIGSTGSDSTALMKAHGIIMIFAWIVLVSTGILTARYFKKSWSTRKICGKAVWFAIHRTLMTSVAILTLIAFILILVYKKGQWISQKNQREFAHSIVGILVISFAVIQPFMALFRCNPDDDYRFIFNYAHAFVGFSAFILSIVAIFLAMFFTQFNFQANKEWAILVTWTCWLPVIFIIFEIIEYYFEKHINNEKTNSYDMNDRHGTGTTKTDTIESKENATKSRIKSFFLLVHFIIAFGLSLALMILIGQA